MDYIGKIYHLTKKKNTLFRHFSIKIFKPKSVDYRTALNKFHGPTITLIGKPNVGKSTLFNRLSGKQIAIVHKDAGITRDRKIGQGRLSDLSFIMVDTPGFEELTNKEKKNHNFHSSIIKQSELSIINADIALFIIDACNGLTSNDYAFSKWLKKKSAKTELKVILVANKSEKKDKTDLKSEIYELGLGEPVYISALHNQGMADLYNSINNSISSLSKLRLNPNPKLEPSLLSGIVNDNLGELDPTVFKGEKSVLRLAIVGRPNVGKSTLVNSIIKYVTKDKNAERVVTGSTPGITRDSISINIRYEKSIIKLIDTAGILGTNHMSYKKYSKPVSMAMEDTLKSIAFSNVVCLIIDVNLEKIKEFLNKNLDLNDKIELTKNNEKRIAELLITKKDLKILNKIIKEGRSLMIALNKCDLIKSHLKLIDIIKKYLLNLMPIEMSKVEVVPLSSLYGIRTDEILKKALGIHKRWNDRISTSTLNKWINEIFKTNPPPKINNKPIKIKYITQIKTRPPTFAIFCSKKVPLSYQTFLANNIKKEFDFEGIPIRLEAKEVSNPFLKRSEKSIRNHSFKEVKVIKSV